MVSVVLATTLSTIDITIVVGFLIAVTAIGWIASRAASQGVEDYFLGGNKIPWWVLGISSATSNFDMAGTMIIVAVVYSLGYQGFLVEMRGGVGLSLAFLMVFLGKWLRRSRVMTSAEWMKLRFGTDKSGRAAHLLSALANIVLSLGMIIYFSKGAGKFLTHFIPIPDTDLGLFVMTGEMWCTAIMVAVGLFYTLLSGLYGVVFTDVAQMLLLGFTAIYVTVEAYNLAPTVAYPEGMLDMGLSIDASSGGAATLVARDSAAWTPIFDVFGLAVGMWVFRTVLEGMGGVGGYTDQRFFAARSEREASLLTAEAVVLSIMRWTMVSGLVVMGLHVVQEGMTGADVIAADPEQVLPVVLSEFLPSGVRGIVVAGLVAAAMSTFDSTLNAGASYIVRDVYQTYVKPEADGNDLMRVSRWAPVGHCVAGVALAAVVPNINKIWGLIAQRLQVTRAPSLLYQESDLVLKAMRDLFSPDIDEVVVDSQDVYLRIRDFADKLMPKMAERIRLHESTTPLFHAFGIERDVEGLYEPRVELKNGGSIVIEQTEALVAIDINSGRFKPGTELEATAFRTNAEAVPEIVRQLRLRDLGGLIIIDFIDMSEEKHRKQLERMLIDALRGDRARIKVGRISAFGMIEITRQRVGPGLKHNVFGTCRHCSGTGLSRTVPSRAIAVLRDIRAMINLKGFSILQAYLSPAVADYLVNYKRRSVLDLEEDVGKRCVFKAEPSYPVDMVHYRFLTADGQEAKVNIPAGLGVRV